MAPKIPSTLTVLEKRTRRRDGPLPSLFTIDADLGIRGARRWTRDRIELVAAGSFGDLGGADGGDSGSADGCGGDGCGSCGD